MALPPNHPTGRPPTKSAPKESAPGKPTETDMLPPGLVAALQSKQWRTHNVSTKAPDHRVAQAHTEPKAGSHAKLPAAQH